MSFIFRCKQQLWHFLSQKIRMRELAGPVNFLGGEAFLSKLAGFGHPPSSEFDHWAGQIWKISHWVLKVLWGICPLACQISDVVTASAWWHYGGLRHTELYLLLYTLGGWCLCNEGILEVCFCLDLSHLPLTHWCPPVSWTEERANNPSCSDWGGEGQK